MVRATFILISIKPIRRNTLRLCKILWLSREIIILFLINWFLFSAIARVFFQMYTDYYDNPIYYLYNYSTFLDTLFSLYVLITAANYPDTFVAKYYTNRFVFIFYLIYTFVTIFIVINMLTGVLYFNYAKTVTSVVEKNLHNEEFCMLMKLCLKDGIVRNERVNHIIETYRENPVMIQFKVL